MRYSKARIALIFWCLFVGIGAVFGSFGMFYDISGKWMGMDALLPYFQVLPFAEALFQNFLFPGFALLIVNGISNLTAAYLLLRHQKLGIILGMTFGITLMMWITIQFIIFPQNILSTSFFIFGFIQAATGYACLVFYRQEHYDFIPESYKNIGTNSKILVVYYSRLNRTAKVAYECANRLGADIYRLTTSEFTEDTLGFWWCGRFGMHKWPMPVDISDLDLEKYDKVVIVTPVWVFSFAAPVRDFLFQAKGRIKKASYIAVHFNPWLPKSIFSEMDDALGIKGSNTYSVSSALGTLKLCKQ